MEELRRITGEIHQFTNKESCKLFKIANEIEIVFDIKVQISNSHDILGKIMPSVNEYNKDQEEMFDRNQKMMDADERMENRD